MPTVLVVHPSADVYGSDLQLLESIAGMLGASWRVHLHLPAAGPLLGRVPESVDVTVRPFLVLRKAILRPVRLLGAMLRAPVDLVHAVAAIRRTRPDVIYVNTVTIPLWIAAARLCRVPVLVHVHEAEEDIPRALRLALNAPLLLADRVIANSDASRRVVTEVLPALARRTEVVPNGVPDPGARPMEDAEPDRVAVVGRLSPRKGIDVALDAVARLRGEGRDVRLEVCGSVFPGYEWYERELRDRAAKSDLAGAVTFSGYVNPTAPVLARASVVLVPSRVEPFGNTVVEGMLAQRPVVASRVQGPAEIITDGRTGLLVAPDDAASLARAIERLLADRGFAKQLADQGRAEALRRFAVDEFQEKILHELERLVRR